MNEGNGIRTREAGGSVQVHLLRKEYAPERDQTAEPCDGPENLSNFPAWFEYRAPTDSPGPLQRSVPAMRRTIFHRKCDPETVSTMHSPISSRLISSISTFVDALWSISLVRKRRKIMKPGKPSAGSRHFAGVEPVFHPPDVPLGKSRSDARDNIEVDPLFRVVAGMEIGLNGLGAEDIDACRQNVIEAVYNLFCREFSA